MLLLRKIWQQATHMGSLGTVCLPVWPLSGWRTQTINMGDAAKTLVRQSDGTNLLLVGNIRAMAVVQVISFLVLFPSTGQVPIELMDGWLATMARWNPATPVLAMTRQGFLGEISGAETWPGLLVVAGGLALFGAFARSQLRRLDG